jgi:hypothetical protein
MRLAAILFLLCAGLSGCATTPAVGIGKGQEVAFQQVALTYPRQPIGLSNAAIFDSARFGAGGGAVIGALAGLSCGPLFVLCSPIGAVIYGAGGALIGAGVGVAQTLPSETLEQLQRRVEAFSASHDVPAELMAAIAERGKGHWLAVAATPSTPVVQVRIESVSLYNDQVGRVGLGIRLFVITRPPGGDRRDETDRKFEYVGTTSEPRLWIEDPDDFVATSFRNAYVGIAHDVFAYLAK